MAVGAGLYHIAVDAYDLHWLACIDLWTIKQRTVVAHINARCCIKHNAVELCGVSIKTLCSEKSALHNVAGAMATT
jgi:hypothetical protein